MLALLLALVLTALPDDPLEERVVVAREATAGITIDGRLEEIDWIESVPASGFLQYEPVEGAAPSQRTEVHVVFASQAIYIGAILYDSEPDRIQPTLGRRDDFNQADWFIASIDSYLDRKSAYTFGVNAGGVQMDGITTRELDRSWDAVWQSSVRRTPDGWVAEMRIPLSMLRFSDGAQNWGINFRRVIPRTSEVLEWAMVPRTERSSGYVARYGTLAGLGKLSPRRNVQVLPYSVSRVDRFEADDGGVQTGTQADLGVDFKVGLSSNWTLDGTFNPDFGQVDADPAELNLTAFESFFEERRPFFIEGADILSFRMSYDGSLLYTRRIGSREPIIAAGKLSGRTANGLSLGVLTAATGSDFAPGRAYGVLRARQELGRYSRVGVAATGFGRTESGSRMNALTAGADWDIRFSGADYSFDGFFTAARRDLTYDGSVQSGFAGSIGLDKVRGTVSWGSSFRIFSDEFNPNDLGRLRRADFMRWSNSIEYQIRGGQPFGAFKRGSMRVFGWQGWSYRDLLNTGAGIMLRSTFVTRGFQEISVRAEAENIGRAHDLYETRGRGPFVLPRAYSANVRFETDSRRTWKLQPSVDIGHRSGGGNSLRTGLDVEWNAGTRLRLSTDLGLSKADNQLAWASNESFRLRNGESQIGLESGDPSNVGDAFLSFSGDRLASVLHGVDRFESGEAWYVSVFGRRDTRSLDWSMRSNVTFNPNLSLQFYGQLFVARGHFDDYGLLVDSDQIASFPEYPKQHDFSVASFQTNLVLRWEYRPGSALFLVWSQSRRDNHVLDPFDTFTRSPYRDSAGSQISEVFDAFPANAFLVKINYLFLR